MHNPAAQVSILIPCYNCASFIDRTLNFARGQTFGDLTIRISIDVGDDNTPLIVRSHAARDARIVVHEQRSRLGWVGNVNFLLGQVDTPYFFLYFHDDVLLPQYTAYLLARLEACPQAAGAYCDMGHFGGADHVSTGPAYLGSTVERLLTLMLAPQRGSPLRALLRTERAGELRLPDMETGGFWANEPFLMSMLVAGTLAHVPEVLYLRWSNRGGGLTDGWKQLPAHDIVNGWRANIDARLNIIWRATGVAAEREALVLALYLQTFPVLRELRDERGNALFPTPASLHPQFETTGTPQLLARYGPVIEGWARASFERCQARRLHSGSERAK
jgi:glycosyltransferase involved in cell wall biosynthesis